MTIDRSHRSALLRLRASLSDALDLVDQGLPGSARVPLPGALDGAAPLDPDDRRRREHLPSDYAHIGGRDVARGHADAFTSPWWRDSYRPGAASEMFIAYCGGQIELRRNLRQPCYYVDACGAGEAWEQIQAMKRERVGSGCFVGGRYREDDRNWSEWNLCWLSAKIVPSPMSPVTLTERVIVARPPETFEPDRFEAAMRAEIRKGSLAAWLETEEGRRHCALLEVDPALGARFTSAPAGAGGEPRPVDNIVMRQQQAAQGRLIAIAERMILSHVRERHPESA